MSNPRTYDDEFVAAVKDYAVMGLHPRQIAERMNLTGLLRRDFLMDIASKCHPLHEAYLMSRAHGEEDPIATLVTIADAGDTSALELLSKINRQAAIDQLKKELFDV